MSRNTAYKGCKRSGYSYLIEQNIACTIISGFSSFLKSVLGTTLPVLAAFTCGCIRNEDSFSGHYVSKSHCSIAMQIKDTEENPGQNLRCVDVFVFNTDSLGGLDSYQKIEDISDGSIHTSSTEGRKKILACCNMNLKRDDIINIGSIQDLRKRFCRLEDLQRGFSPMQGLTECITGPEHSPVKVVVMPLTSEIVLRSIRCEFSGTPYDGEPMTDAKVYLTNVNAQCSLAGSVSSEQRFINVGMLNMEDMASFREPEIIVQDIRSDIGEEVLKTDIRLLCFQNYSTDESPGTPFTRLVVEGKIEGELYYWPVNVNRHEGEQGIKSNTRHVFDLTIRRKGCRNPDDEMIIDESETMMEVLQWEEKEEYSVGF